MEERFLRKDEGVNDKIKGEILNFKSTGWTVFPEKFRTTEGNSNELR